MDRLSGTVKFWNKEKKYGFIKAEDGREFFFHLSGIADGTTVPDKNMEVRFRLGNSEKGPKAVEVEFV